MFSETDRSKYKTINQGIQSKFDLLDNDSLDVTVWLYEYIVILHSNVLITFFQVLGRRFFLFFLAIPDRLRDACSDGICVSVFVA